MNTEIIKNNKLIAEFMGYIVDRMLDYYEWYDLETGETTPFVEAYYD